jgi:hypothetical protein
MTGPLRSFIRFVVGVSSVSIVFSASKVTLSGPLWFNQPFIRIECVERGRITAACKMFGGLHKAVVHSSAFTLHDRPSRTIHPSQPL